MFKLLEYFGRLQAIRGTMLGLPAWARLLVFIAAIPGILLISLSLVAVLVSIFVLLLLTVPLYRVLNALVGPPAQPRGERQGFGFVTEVPMPSPGRKKVDVTIIE
jgi:hypothetical protein